jgi:hypothetical protein
MEQKKAKVVTPAVGGGQGYGGDESPDASAAVASIDQALGKVTIIHGANEVSYEVAGKSVKYIRDALSAVLTIPSDAQALIDGKPVTDEANTILASQQTCEFIKSSGVKGIC